MPWHSLTWQCLFEQGAAKLAEGHTELLKMRIASLREHLRESW